MIKNLLAAGCAVACLAAAGQASAKDYNCAGKSEVEDRGELEVTFVVDSKGKVKSRAAVWTPPTPDGGALASVLGGKPSLTVEYDKPSDQGLGAPSSLASFSMVFTSDGTIFDRAGFVFEVPDGRRWAGETVLGRGQDNNGNVSMMMIMGDFAPSEAANRDLFADLDSFGRVRVAIMRDGRAVSQATYDLSARGERDALFIEAWAKAVAAAADYKHCPKADR